jgi:hypothetical protein
MRGASDMIPTQASCGHVGEIEEPASSQECPPEESEDAPDGALCFCNGVSSIIEGDSMLSRNNVQTNKSVEDESVSELLVTQVVYPLLAARLLPYLLSQEVSNLKGRCCTASLDPSEMF